MERIRSKKWLIAITFTLMTILIVTPNILLGSVNVKENLLTNPDAETGDTQGWVDSDNAWSADNVITPHGGNYFFWPARLDVPYTRMYQDVDISGYVSSIDSGNAYLHLSGWLCNWDQYPHDRATLAIEVLDTNNQQLLYLSRHHRNPVWAYYQIESQIPIGSRTLRVYLIATRYVGSDNDGYFDDLCLEIDTNVPDIFVTITPEGGAPEVAVDSTLQLYATTTGGTDSAYIWSSSFEAIATVDDSGLVTAHKDGLFIIQAEGILTHAIGYLEIVAYLPNYVVFTHPQSGEEWEAGTVQDVTWELIGSIDSATLYYSTTGGSEWTEIDKIPDLTVQQYSWLIPDTNEILNDCILKMVWNSSKATSSVFFIVPSVYIEEDKDASYPTVFRLLQNHPNPFIQSTVISYQVLDIKACPYVSLQIYDLMGRLVKTLVNENKKAGCYTVNWDGKDKSGKKVVPGIYFYRMEVGDFKTTRKLTIIH